MSDPAGITVIRREGTHATLRFVVTIWTNSQGACTVESVDVVELPPHKITEWMLFDSVDEAYRRGEELAKQIIAAWSARQH